MRSNDRVNRQIEVMERAERAAQQDATPEHPQAARLESIVEELVAELSGANTTGADGQAKP